MAGLYLLAMPTDTEQYQNPLAPLFSWIDWPKIATDTVDLVNRHSNAGVDTPATGAYTT